MPLLPSFITLRAGLVIFGLLLHAAFLQAQSPAALQEALHGHYWTWKSAQSDTLVVFQNDGTLLTREKKSSLWQTIDGLTVRVTFPSQQTADLTFSPDYTRFVQSGNTLSPITGARAQARPGGAAAAPATPVATAQPALPPGEIRLAQEWIPNNVHTRKVLMDSTDFFSRAILGSEPDVIPTVIWGPITWLMPLQDAMTKLPDGARRHRAFRITNLAFPQGSLNVTTMALDGRVAFEDRCNKFKYLSFICDLENRVIGVQLVDANPKAVNWPAPGPDGIREPYFNFIEDRYNGSSGSCVPYQVIEAGKGVKLIKTVLFNQADIILPHGPGQCPGTIALTTYSGRPYLENVHWYLTAPLAKKLHEIVTHVRKQGLDDK